MNDNYYDYLHNPYVIRRNEFNARLHNTYMHGAAKRVAEAVRYDLRRRGRRWSEDRYGNIKAIYFPRGGPKKATKSPFKYPYVPVYKRGQPGRHGWRFERDRERWREAIKQAVYNYKHPRIRLGRTDLIY